MIKTLREIGEVTQVSPDDSIFCIIGEYMTRLKVNSVISRVTDLLGVNISTLKNPYNKPLAGVAVSEGKASNREGFSISQVEYEDNNYGSYFAMSGTGKLTIPTNAVLLAVVIRGTSNSGTPVTLTLDNKRWTLPPKGHTPLTFAHVLPLGTSTELEFNLSSVSLLYISMIYGNLLGKNFFHLWNSPAGGGIVDGKDLYCDVRYNETLQGGDVVYGHPSVVARLFADLSTYKGLTIRCTPKSSLRIIYNRETDTSTPKETYVTADANGIIRYEIDKSGYFHLNAIKIPFEASDITVYDIMLRR